MGFFSRLFPGDVPVPGFGSLGPSADQTRRALMLTPAVLRLVQSGKPASEQTSALVRAALSLPCFARGPFLGGDAAVEVAMMVSAATRGMIAQAPKTAVALLLGGLSLDDRKAAVHLALKSALMSAQSDAWDLSFIASMARALGLSEDDFDSVFSSVQVELA